MARTVAGRLARIQDPTARTGRVHKTIYFASAPGPASASGRHRRVPGAVGVGDRGENSPWTPPAGWTGTGLPARPGSASHFFACQNGPPMPAGSGGRRTLPSGWIAQAVTLRCNKEISRQMGIIPFHFAENVAQTMRRRRRSPAAVHRPVTAAIPVTNPLTLAALALFSCPDTRTPTQTTGFRRKDKGKPLCP